jgi:hypothetical protein
MNHRCEDPRAKLHGLSQDEDELRSVHLGNVAEKDIKARTATLSQTHLAEVIGGVERVHNAVQVLHVDLRVLREVQKLRSDGVGGHGQRLCSNYGTQLADNQ